MMLPLLNGTIPPIAVNKPSLLILIIILLGMGCEQKDRPKNIVDGAITENPFFGIAATDTPQLLAPKLLASPLNEYNGTFSPDGTLFYYTTDSPNHAYITFTQMKADSSWSEPKIASFSGKFPDYDPIFSLDGERVYFSSRRPKDGTKKSRVWYVERQDSLWGSPRAVTLTDGEDNEFYSSLTKEDILYFNIWAKGDIYRAVLLDSVYQVEPLPSIINSGGDKGDPFISPDEDYLLFRGYDDSLGRGDLYISFNIQGSWTAPENLGEPINSEAHEMCPWVSHDGKFMVFASGRVLQDKVETIPLEPIKKVYDSYDNHDNGQLNLYYVSTDFIQRMREKHLN